MNMEAPDGLSAEIEAADIAPRSVVIWWLGQSGFVIKGKSATIVIDAYLSDAGGLGRTYDPPLEPASMRSVNIVLGTHDHIDHIDPISLPLLLDAARGAVAVVPATAVASVVKLGIDESRVIPAHADKAIPIGGIRIRPLAAAHADDPRSGYGFYRDESGQHPFLSYVLDLDGVRLFHAGDTVLYEGLDERLKELEVDVLFLPINGRSWFREAVGSAGNLNIFEAAELARRSGAQMVIPMHYDMFRGNREDVGHFVSFAVEERIPTHVVALARGRRFDVVGRSN
jgi:L-ascorbate 6-phosphate lactonase